MNDPRDQLNAISHIHSAAVAGARDHYRRLGLLELTVPVLVGITGACENVSTLFKVEGSPRIHMTQTGQLALEHGLGFATGVCCVTPSFRTDRIDERHLNEFTLIEEEVSHLHPSVDVNPYDPSTMFERLLDHITVAFRAITERVINDAGEHVERAGGDPEELAETLAAPFARIGYGEAVELLQSAGHAGLRWGDDLTARWEAELIELVATRGGRKPAPTFVTHFPAHIKFFNMRVDDADPRCVQSADLLLPYAGEAVGAAVREHDHGRLVKRLTESVMFTHLVEQKLGSLKDFEPYLETIRKGTTAAHAGYGIGLERAIQFFVRSTDIRDASVPYLLSVLTGFAEDLREAQPGSRSPGF